MTFASKITLGRIFLVPVFAVLAIYYGISVEERHPEEWLRLAALITFITAAASDGIDGWIARRFDQHSHFGKIIDPIADKALMLTGFITLTAVDWGPDGWRIPLWFTALVIVRDFIILGGVTILHVVNNRADIQTHWTGKVCTVTQMFALGWVMLKWVPFSPIYPCAVAALFTVWSGAIYLSHGIAQLREPPDLPGSER